MLFINVPHPFSIVLKRFYCSQEVLSKIPKPIENNRKWVWWVYNYCERAVKGKTVNPRVVILAGVLLYIKRIFYIFYILFVGLVLVT